MHLYAPECRTRKNATTQLHVARVSRSWVTMALATSRNILPNDRTFQAACLRPNEWQVHGASSAQTWTLDLEQLIESSATGRHAPSRRRQQVMFENSLTHTLLVMTR